MSRLERSFQTVSTWVDSVALMFDNRVSAFTFIKSHPRKGYSLFLPLSISGVYNTRRMPKNSSAAYHQEAKRTEDLQDGPIHMKLTSPVIQKALEFAYNVHQVDQHQSRKGKQVPYIFHVLAVANILERAGASESVVAAGILHDTIEDSTPEKPVTRKMLEKVFGADIARIVNDLSEQDTSLPWIERKMLALAHVAEMEQDSLLVKSADVLHNLSDQLDDYAMKGEVIFANFNAPKDAQLKRYRLLVDAIKKRWSDNPLLPLLQEKLKSAQTAWSDRRK